MGHLVYIEKLNTKVLVTLVINVNFLQLSLVLLNDKENKHEGLSYPCDKCDFCATQFVNLRRHKESKHEIKDACDLCKYFAKSVQNLKYHVISKHLGIRYNCVQC